MITIRRQLRDNIFTLMNQISDIQDKHKRPTYDFKGYPAAFVVPSGNEGDYLTTNENIRVYAFKVWVFQEYDVTNQQRSYDILMDVTDVIMEKIDEQESPTSDREMANGIGTGYTLVAVMATPGRFALDENEKLLACELTVRCKVTVDLTLLT